MNLSFSLTDMDNIIKAQKTLIEGMNCMQSTNPNMYVDELSLEQVKVLLKIIDNLKFKQVF